MVLTKSLIVRRTPLVHRLIYLAEAFRLMILTLLSNLRDFTRLYDTLLSLCICVYYLRPVSSLSHSDLLENFC